MRILVTGGLGFIGRRLCGALADAGVRVRCVDDLSGSGGAGAPVPAETVIAPADPMHLVGMDAVIHLAALPGVRSRSTPAALRAANVELTDRLAAAAALQGTRFVFVSSSSVYGDARVLPTPEHSPLAPINPYAASKAAAEQAVLSHGGDPVIVRPFTVYGPGQRPDMAFARWIAAMRACEPIPWHAGPGTARDFTYVDDAVAGLMAALRRGRSGEAYNVSGWRSVQLPDALELLGAPAVRDLPCSTSEALVTSGCKLKAAAELGYAPRVELADGLRRQLGAVTTPSLAA
jgi:UDP-glucuronate 4-epimerase